MPSRNIGEAVPPATRAPEPARESRTEATMPSPKGRQSGSPPQPAHARTPSNGQSTPRRIGGQAKRVGPIPGHGGEPPPPTSTNPHRRKPPFRQAWTLTLRLPEAPMKQKAADSAAPPATEGRGRTGIQSRPRPPGAASRAEKAETAKKSAKSLRLSEDDIAPAPGDRRAIAAEVRRLISQANGRLVGPDSSRGNGPAAGTARGNPPPRITTSFLTHLRELCAVEPDRKEDFRPLPGTTIRLTLKFSIP